jgi:hypothetical protein
MRLLLSVLAAAMLTAAAPRVDSTAVTVRAAETLPGPLEGRLLLFVKPKGAAPSASIDAKPFAPTAVWVVGQDVEQLQPGGATTLRDLEAFPSQLSDLPPGAYEAQAVLDRDRDYNLFGRGEGDSVSAVTTFTVPGPPPELVLDRVLPAAPPPDAALRGQVKLDYQAELARLEPVELRSPSLSAFWGRDVAVRAWVVMPPDYDPRARATYPTVYLVGGFGSSYASLRGMAASVGYRMTKGTMPPLIWVFLDGATTTGYHVFADSVNNGPWGRALTAEMIPYLERRFRMQGGARGRYLTGHSSGGWSSLWLQVNYPDLFGGAWATSPDPVDFHRFIRADLYTDTDFLVDRGGAARPLIREGGKVVSSVRDFARLERVLGHTGGQMASLEWTFSPRAPTGGPALLFDRRSGRIDPAVARYWRERYDLSALVSAAWPRRRAVLDGKIHVVVGEADTFFLDESVRGLEAVLSRLGARASFRYLPGKTHFDLYERDGDYNALRNDIAWEIWNAARPGCPRPALSSASPTALSPQTQAPRPSGCI